MLKKIRALSSTNNSLMITIPIYMVDILRLKANQNVEISIKGKRIIIDTDISKIDKK